MKHRVPKFEPNIPEGSLQYSIFRFFTVVMLLLMMFALIWNVKETRINRDNGYKNRSVVCAILKSQVMDNDQGSNDSFIIEAYQNECETGKVKELYPNAAR